VTWSTDDSLSFGTRKKTLSGRAGSYTWTSVDFVHELGKAAWTAKAPAASGCKLTWRFESWDGTVIGKSVTVRKGGSASGTRQFVADAQAGELTVKDSCKAWSLAITSFVPPKGWNPWGYNFTPGRLIYSAPDDFCSYFDCIASFWNSTNGYVAQCSDGMFSHSGGRPGACSWHGGTRRPLYRH
jgi:hypothetical protein